VSCTVTIRKAARQLNKIILTTEQLNNYIVRTPKILNNRLQDTRTTKSTSQSSFKDPLEKEFDTTLHLQHN